MLWWKDSLKTGNEMIDEQHKQIFELGSRVLDLNLNSKKEEIEKIFQNLIEYTRKHFTEEESMMRDYRYSNLKEHHVMHQEFIQKLHYTLQGFKAKGFTEDNVENLKFLMVDWLINHINEEDKDFIQMI